MCDGESRAHFTLARQEFQGEAISLAEGKFH
jgi:hypothetical protein